MSKRVEPDDERDPYPWATSVTVDGNQRYPTQGSESSDDEDGDEYDHDRGE